MKCTPHVGMGMVAAIVVGDAPANVEKVKAVKLPKKGAGAPRRGSPLLSNSIGSTPTNNPAQYKPVCVGPV